MMDLTLYGYDGMETPPEGLIPGRIIEAHFERYKVITELGEVSACLKGSFFYNLKDRGAFPYVGDFVLLQYNENGDSLIVKLLDRKSKFSRADHSGRGRVSDDYAKVIVEQVVATNFDFVFIITSLNRDFRINRIMRYLTQAWQSGGQPVIILTKADLVDNFSTQLDEVAIAAPGVPVHAISSYTGFGLDKMDEYLKPGKTIVFLGMSGVGKSSLLNKLAGKEIMTVKETRKEDASKGSHTTTHRQLFMLKSGAMIIDTPGMREMGLYGAEDGLGIAFSDIEELFSQCRFADCHHRTEPGCAVHKALVDGSLHRDNWERYLSQMRENKFSEDRAGHLVEKNEFFKSGKIQQRKNAKNSKKNGGF